MKGKAILFASLAAAVVISGAVVARNVNAESAKAVIPEKIASFGTFTYDGNGDGAVVETDGDIQIKSDDIQNNRFAIRRINLEIWGNPDGPSKDNPEDSLTAKLAKEINDRTAGDAYLQKQVDELKDDRTKYVMTEINRHFERTKSYSDISISNGETITFADIDPSFYISDVDVTYGQNYGSLPKYTLDKNTLKITFPDPLPSIANGKINIRNIDVTYANADPAQDKY